MIFTQFVFGYCSSALALELPITVDGSTNTQIDQSLNQIPVVNIAPVNSSGLSHNKFSDYNVNNSGLIINNASGNPNGVVLTKIGGIINDNPNLKNSGSASIILNEVTSNNISKINGYSEIAGQKADLILANPNGFVMNQAGFINVGKLTAVVGSSMQSNPNPNQLNFKLSDDSYQLNHGFLPKLIITGNDLKGGLDLENINSTDLVANIMNIVAPIYGSNNEVNLLAGDKSFNYSNKEISSNNFKLTSPCLNQEKSCDNKVESLAIDASTLGKIQAGRIFIIASKEGFGIKYSGDLLASRAGIIIDSQGNIDYNNIASELGNIEITSNQGNINSNGITQTKDFNSDIKLTTKTNDIVINSKLLSARDIVIDAKKNFYNNNPELNFSNNNFTIKAIEITNLGQILANNNLKIDGKILNNNNSNSILKAINKFELNLNIINNLQGKLITDSLLEINIQEANDYQIKGDIFSNGDIKIKANNITNQTNLQANGSIEIEAKDQFTNGILSQDNSNIKIIANDNLKIISNNLLNNYATLSSKKDLLLSSKFSNINNNVNAEIIGGTGLLSLIAKNGTVNQNSPHSLVSNGDYSLDVVDFVNTGKVDISRNLTLNISNDLVNEERAMIYAGGNMMLNVVNNLTNKTGAVIYSEGDLTIQKYSQYNLDGSVNLLYNQANNRINKLDNLSGDITSYVGDMVILANTINNKRSVDPGIWLIKPDRANGEAYYYSWNDGEFDLKFTNHSFYSWKFIRDRCFGSYCKEYQAQYSASSPLNLNSRESTIFSGKKMTLDSPVINNETSNILSNSDLTIISEELNNKSKNYPELIFINTNDRHREYSDNAEDFSGDFPIIPLKSNIFTSYIKSGGSLFGSGFKNLNNIIISPNYTKGNTIKFNENQNDSKNVLSNTTSQGKEQDLSIVNSLNLDDLTKYGVINLNLEKYLASSNEIGLFTKSTNPNSPLFETRSQFIDQSKFFGSNYFYQKIGLNLNQIQTQFEQQSARLIGDQFFQTKIIEEQLRTISKNSFLLSTKETNSNNEIKTLIDNASSEYNRLGLTTNKSLTQTQINNLQQDIIWFETKNIDGQSFIVPKIYLSKITRDNLKNNLATKSTIFAKEDIAINSTLGSFTNDGSIIANNINITANNDIINKNFSEIIASNNLSLTSNNGSITNFSNLTAQNNLSLNASQNITNTATVLTNDINLLNSGIAGYKSNNMTSSNTGFIQSKLIETAQISGGNITINAGNDFNNFSAKISATKNILPNQNILSDGSIATTPNTTSGNIAITAGDDINISTLQLRNRSETRFGSRKKGGTSVIDQTKNIASNIESAGNLSLITTGLSTITPENNNPVNLDLATTTNDSDINIIGSNLSTTSTGSSIDINATNSINIASAIDSSYKMSTFNKKGMTVKKSSIDINSSTTNISSNINALGDINITSGDDTNIIASNLSGLGSGSINSGGDTNIYNATNTSYSYFQSSKTQMGIIRQIPIVGPAINVLTKALSPAFSLVNGVSAGNLQEIQQLSTINSNKNNLIKNSTNELLVASNLNFTNDLNINSNVDLVIKASNLKTTSGDILLASNNDVKILSNTQTSTSNQNYLDKTDRFKDRSSLDNTNITNISSIITSGSDLNIISQNNTTIQSSKLSSGDNLTIDAKNNLLLLTTKNIAIKNQTSTNKSTYSFANGSSGYINAKAVNNEITSNINNLNNNLNSNNIGNNLNSNTNSGINSNLSLNATNSIIVQYQSETMENLISSTNDNFNNNLNDLASISGNLLNPVSLNNNNLDSLNPIITSQNSINPNNNHQELQYLKILYNLSQTNPQNNPQTNSQNNSQNNLQTNLQTNPQNNFNKIILNPIDDINQQWDQTTRGLTSTSQVAIVVAAVVVSCALTSCLTAPGVTAIGASSGATAGATTATTTTAVSTATTATTATALTATTVTSASLAEIATVAGSAALTAGATSAATTATISATNASMNTDSNLLNSTKVIADNSWKATTSNESLRNIAISAGVAVIAYGVGEWMKSEGVNPSLESGTMENSKVGVNVEKVDGQWFVEGKDIKANWFDSYVAGNQNPVFKAFNTTPGAPSFTGFHDAMNFPVGVNQITIAPYYAMSQCASIPTLCAMFPDTFIKVGTWGLVDTNLDIYKNDYEQQRN